MENFDPTLIAVLAVSATYVIHFVYQLIKNDDK